MWLPVAEYEGIYEVSDAGEVRSLDRVTSDGKAIKGKLISTKPDNHGYSRLNLHGRGARKTVRLHVLVANAFIGPRPIGLDICHGDGDKSNNKASNLRYDTKSGNEKDKVKHGTDNIGDRHGMAKLTEQDVRNIRKRCASGESQSKVAADYKIWQTAVSQIVRRARWSHVTD